VNTDSHLWNHLVRCHSSYSRVNCKHVYVSDTFSCVVMWCVLVYALDSYCMQACQVTCWIFEAILAECGIAVASRMSICLPLTLRYCDHIGLTSSKIISRLVS